jgi:prevent-host-death family protein
MPRSPRAVLSISEFKATCAAVFERVRATGHSVYVTRRGKLIAEVIPVSRATPDGDWLGAMEGTAKITGVLVAPASRAADWDAMRNK